MRKAMRKWTSVLLAMVLCLGLLSGCGKKAEEPAPEKETEEVATEAPEEEVATEPTEEPAPEAEEPKGVLMMATTTSTADTGLLDYLTELFLEDTGYELQYTAVGTGEALKMGENGDADIVFVHAKASEEAFVEAGYGVERIPVMYNDFVVVGPTGIIEDGKSVEDAFKEILEEQLPFVSRGDDSGTDKKEKGIWAALELDQAANPNYIESGQGMGATITMADEKMAFCLADRGTWLKQKTDGDLAIEIEIVCQGDKSLLNQYGVIAVNPDKYPEVNNEAANKFIEWICSADIQKLIGEFGVDKFGEPLFVPNAGADA